ncbi:type IV secretion system protein [Candidatus Nanosynbacter sp. TM7-008]|uniref:type IV secretion system protein n=1 Tax=Candidatus Nanosynbacter sp. TM7-008 TaxID=2902632 RepID=UPI001FB6C7EA|nr:type IV secretion system protein [Candidatus Nanosynbacter sp. TM7-008]MCJ1963854.1 type IV secretion system protein [Candidatus Nanosynbacter sp. TM7-008]
MKVFMFNGKQVVKKVGRLKKPIIILCAFALFILPIANILSAHPALASKDPSRFGGLSKNDQYNFYVYASVIAACFNNSDSRVHKDVDDQMLTKNEMFRNTVWVYAGTYPNVKSFTEGAINCGDTEFQQEVFNLFGTSPNELMCYMGYPKNGLKGKNDTEAKHEECAALGLTNDFTYDKMPDKGSENFLNALKTLTGYDHTKAEKDAYIKYRKYSDWIKGCVDGEATSKSDNTWKVSVVNTDTKKVDTIYKPKGKSEHMYSGYENKHYYKPEFSCKSIESELAIAAKRYLTALKANAVDTACAGLAGEKLKACKDGASHKSDSAYCETTYENTEDINACKQGQSAKIEAPEEEEGGEPKNSCGIDGGLGWLICPVMTFVANINDAAYGSISGFLDIKPAILSSGDNSGAKQGWDFFRNIANAIFAVIFLWIIFSQISNVGVSNYGIKKILPRLIIGALLVNLSYYLCQIFVDLSNILGHTLKDALESGAGEIGTESEAAGWISSTAAALVGVGGVAAFAALAIGIPTLAAGFLAIMTVFIILVVRQAGIILLISMSPIAFAAWLLPNTEDLFKKWMKMFRGLLLVFPIISLLYGAGKLAGAVLASSATVDPNNPDETLQLVALAATTMPLIATPFVLQNSLSSLGSIGAKIGKLSSAANGNLKNAVMNKSRISDVKNAWKSRSARKLAERRSGNTWYGRTASNLRDSSSWLKKGAGIAMNPAAALDNKWVGKKIGLGDGASAAQEAYDKAAMEKAERALTYQYGGDAAAALKDKNADKYIRIAAVNQLKGQGTYGADKIAEYLGAGGKVDSVSMAKSLTDMKGSHAGVAEAGTEALKALQEKDGPSEIKFSSDRFNSLTASGVSKLSNKDIAGQSANAIQNSNITADQATEILSDDMLYSSANNAVKSALMAKGGERIIPQTPQDNQNDQQNNSSSGG